MRVSVPLAMCFIGVLVLGGCSKAPRQLTCAGPEVAQFHDYFNAGNYEAIASEVDTTAWVVHKNELKLWLAGIHRTLGPVLDSRPTMLQRQTRGGSGLRCYYDTRFEVGAASERFTWSSVGSHPKLSDYRMQSLGNAPRIGNGPAPN